MKKHFLFFWRLPFHFLYGVFRGQQTQGGKADNGSTAAASVGKKRRSGKWYTAVQRHIPLYDPGRYVLCRFW